MVMEVTQVLMNAQAVDDTLRNHAEENLKQFQEQNLSNFLLSLAGELANDDKPTESRKLAGLILKNALDAKHKYRKFELAKRWFSLDSPIKVQIKMSLLKTLSSLVHDARSTASQVIAKVARIELPQKQWPELVGVLLSNIHQLPVHTKQATLETLGYICEEVSPDVVDEDEANKIVTAVVQGMDSSELNSDVKLAASQALYNALGFARAKFSDVLECDHIMKVVCEAAFEAELEIRLAALECLVAMASAYYDKLSPYIHEILAITSFGMRGDEERVTLQSIEFWSSICDKEIDILDECGSDFSDDSDIICFYFIKKTIHVLVPTLLKLLLEHEEDEDGDGGAWNIRIAGGTCLGLIAQTVGDDVIPLVIPFMEVHMAQLDWREREAATYAFGLILEGPSFDRLLPIVPVALHFMLRALIKDKNNHVKETTAWTVGRMFEFLHRSTSETPIITEEQIQYIIPFLIQSLKDVPNVAEKACGALYFLTKGYENVEPSFFPLTSFLMAIIQELFTVAHREDAGKSRLRTAAYETINEVVSCSTEETALLVMQLVPLVTMELQQTFKEQMLSSDQRDKQNELQGLLCGCLQVFLQKLGSMESTKYVLMQYTDQMMDVFKRVFSSRSATARVEAMSAIGAVVHATGPNFEKYMLEFYKYLEMGLQNFEDYQVCAITIGVVGEICWVLEDKISIYCDGIMTQLLKDLSRDKLHQSLKPPIFSCFGEIAMAIGDHFDKYLMYAMPMLQSAAEISAHTSDDEEDGGYTNSLRSGILEAYSGILHGFKESPKTQLLMPYAPDVLQFLDSLYMDQNMDERVKKIALVVLGNLAETLGSNVVPMIHQSEPSKHFVKECLASDNFLIKTTATWANLIIF